ncbi:protein FAR1-RELATED SEQUENCE 5-like [Rosa chinensis]|uniref:protein FAR1-RELATED SEQUENCE 5-like n=1 Tax=Rosa chinensis TaxID=74649 RepID=UPI001AD8E837|nr:protein FAR1-RELATED SEQUENCE 5-like [Rosa chinensis]
MESGLRYSEHKYYDSLMDLNSEEGSINGSSDADMENTDFTKEEDMQDFTLFRGKPYQDLTLDDLKEVEFNTIEEVDRFYNYYSLAKGFSMRKYKQDKNRAGTLIIRRQLVCSRQGQRKQSGPNSGKQDSWKDSFVKDCRHRSDGKKDIMGQHPHKKPRTKNRRITRCNCPASLTVRLCTKRGVYYASEFSTEHNHALTRPEHRHFLRSQRHVSDYNLAQVNTLRKVSVRTCRAYEFLVHQAGGYEFVGFQPRDLYNKMQGERREIMMDGDAQSSITWMNLKALRDPHFYCIFSVDEEGRLANMFWRDGQSLTDYNAFGDVLIFDSTYKTNIYGRPLAVFVGCNNHRATVLFGCALLVDETEETYHWAITAFLTSMYGKKPVSVITDSDEAMRNAVTNLIPEARHRLCAWHIGRNVCQHLKNPKTQTDFFHLIFAGLTVEQWESAWQYFVAMNRLENNTWVAGMYNKRHRWGEAFFRDHFFAGICSTQRCEGMHKNLKGGIGRCMRLYEVLPRMEKTVQRIRQQVLYDDYRSENCEPVYVSHMRGLQEDIGRRFTHDIFLLIKDQIRYESKFILDPNRLVDPHTHSVLISLSQYGKPQRRWTVLYQPDENNPSFVCSCKLFESDGIPCCHIFAVIKNEQITTLPESLVNKRWTKEAMVRKTLSTFKEVPDKYVQIARYGELMSQCAKFCHRASYSDEGYDEMREALNLLTIRSEEYSAGILDNLEDEHFEGLHPNVIKDPVVCRTKGSKHTNAECREHFSSNDQPKVGGKCTKCQQRGHNKRTCGRENKLGASDAKSPTPTKVVSVTCSEGLEDDVYDDGTSDVNFDEFKDGEFTKRQSSNLMRHVEEVRPFEFFAGYDISENEGSNTNCTRVPNFFQHFRPFPNDEGYDGASHSDDN